MNKFSLFGLMVFINILTYAQPDKPKQQIHITAVSGNVVYNDSALKKNDLIVIDDALQAFKHFRFSSKTDWIRLRNPETNTITTFYASKPHSCVECLGTRGLSEINNNNDLLIHFSKPLLVFDSDTIITRRATSFHTGNDEVYLWVFNMPSVRESPYFTYAGQNDTLFISHKMMFLELEDESKQFASIYVENLRLAKHNTKTKETVYYKDMPAITLYFFDDVVRFLYSIGMTDEEVYIEIFSNYINDKGVFGRNHLLNNAKEAEEWLKRRIKLVEN